MSFCTEQTVVVIEQDTGANHLILPRGYILQEQHHRLGNDYAVSIGATLALHGACREQIMVYSKLHIVHDLSTTRSRFPVQCEDVNYKSKQRGPLPCRRNG